MIRKYTAFFTAILMLVLLCGCQNTPSVPESKATSPSTPETTLPTEAPKIKIPDPEDLYWKMRYAAGSERANQYTTSTSMNVRFGSDGVYFRTDLAIDSHVIMSGKSFAVNAATRVNYTMMNLEVDQLLETYYRHENGKTVLYLISKDMDLYERQVLDVNFHEVLLQFSYMGYPNALPEGSTVDEEIQTLNDRDVYLLRYTLNGQEYFGTTGDSTLDEALLSLEVPVIYYVDTETYIPLKIQIHLEELGSDISPLIFAAVGGFFAGEDSDTKLEITDLTTSITDMCFEDIPVPEIPATDFQNATGQIGL